MNAEKNFIPDEEYCYENVQNNNLAKFVSGLKEKGCYISEDGHIRGPKGTLRSKLMRNGYYATFGYLNNQIFHFLEHRVVWCWHNGEISNDMRVVHIDKDTTNNKIENLQLVVDEKKGFPVNELEESRYSSVRNVFNVCGYHINNVSSILDLPFNTVSQINDAMPYVDKVQMSEIMTAYPYIVNFTRNKEIPPVEELKNYLMGLNGEVGELTDIFKKVLYHGKDYDPVDVLLEMGDILYYFTAIALVLGIDLSEIPINNNAKLLARYPKGFDQDKSNHRIEDTSVEK